MRLSQTCGAPLRSERRNLVEGGPLPCTPPVLLGVELAYAVATMQPRSSLGVEPGGWDEVGSAVDHFDGPAVFVDAVVVVGA